MKGLVGGRQAKKTTYSQGQHARVDRYESKPSRISQNPRGKARMDGDCEADCEVRSPNREEVLSIGNHGLGRSNEDGSANVLEGRHRQNPKESKRRPIHIDRPPEIPPLGDTRKQDLREPSRMNPVAASRCESKRDPREHTPHDQGKDQCNCY